MANISIATPGPLFSEILHEHATMQRMEPVQTVQEILDDDDYDDDDFKLIESDVLTFL